MKAKRITELPKGMRIQQVPSLSDIALHNYREKQKEEEKIPRIFKPDNKVKMVVLEENTTILPSPIFTVTFCRGFDESINDGEPSYVKFASVLRKGESIDNFEWELFMTGSHRFDGESVLDMKEISTDSDAQRASIALTIFAINEIVYRATGMSCEDFGRNSYNLAQLEDIIYEGQLNITLCGYEDFKNEKFKNLNPNEFDYRAYL